MGNSSQRRGLAGSDLSSSFILLLLLSSGLASEEVAKSDDPADPCSTHALNAYRKCIMDNPCVCKHCNDDPNDDDWIIRAPEPRSCQDVSRIFCPMVRCCTACESVNSFYHACLADKIATIYFGPNHDCQLFICPSQANDFDGECGPTPAPAVVPNPCESEIMEYAICVDRSCESCDHMQIHRLHLPSNTRNCQEMNQEVFCPLESCCPSCNPELNAVASCVETKLAPANDICPAKKCPPTDPPTSQPSSSPVSATLGGQPKEVSGLNAGDNVSAGNRRLHWVSAYLVAFALANIAHQAL